MVVQAVILLIASFFVPGYVLSLCGKKKAAARKPPPPDGMVLSARKENPELDPPKAPEDRGAMADSKDPAYETLAGLRNDCFDKKKKEEAAAASKAGAPASHDPNYQALDGVGDGADKKEGEKKEGSKEGSKRESKEGSKETSKKGSKEGSKEKEKEPEKKEEEPKKDEKKDEKKTATAAPKAPNVAKPGMVATHDPNYQTLVGIGNDVFDKDKDKKKK